ncbi:hypothetical protein CBR_g19125 [Chara braunii]|uniref:Uncharacterized protein n=1 Tax=Chara braunii TaxID=69332 RepID=A0A388KXC7_CHABU|nr:hypothetical protein CBR_g19125 [Chara braunii]|eukprot:GBG74719.1 hypothetical protein CBR_g19125 [Chara braunii]
MTLAVETRDRVSSSATMSRESARSAPSSSSSSLSPSTSSASVTPLIIGGSYSSVPGAHDDVSGRSSRGVQGITVGESFPQLLQYLCNVFWFYPAYVISFVINCLWYNDVATHAFNVIQEERVGGTEASSKEAVKSSSKKRRSRRGSIAGTSAATARSDAAASSGLESVFKAISEEIYRILMFAVFFIQVYAVRFLPFAGPGLNFILLSWLYAYYCFDYKWALLGWTLNRRLWFFETYWAYFLGFGIPCAVISSFFSSLVGSGVMSFLFPWEYEALKRCTGAYLPFYSAS